MPKKNSSWGQNSKATEARERKANQKREEQAKKQKAVEDAYWKDDNKLDNRKKERKVQVVLMRVVTVNGHNFKLATRTKLAIACYEHIFSS